MSDYVIKNYHPDYIELQAEVGKEIVKDWKHLTQTPVEQLKQLYSQSEFDPSTRLYSFKGDLLVGFLTAKTMKLEEEEIGFLRFPFVLEEHKQAEDLLMEKLMEVFKTKGIKRIQGVAGNIWGDSLEIAKRWDFKEVVDRAIAYTLDIDSYELIEDEINVVFFDFEKDIEQIVKIYSQVYNSSPERTKEFYENLTNSDQLLFLPVIKEEGKIVAISKVFKDTAPELIIQGHSFVKDSKYYRSLQNKIIEECKTEGIKTIQMFFREPLFQYISEYEKIGFKFESKTILLEKNI
ncbi:MAG: hypothetical protein HGN29_13750 [Asgard group archaeon]|nr:hypothetical protein [Asgard group archaeon]